MKQSPNIQVNQTTARFVEWLQACNEVFQDNHAGTALEGKEHLEARQGGRYIKIIQVRNGSTSGSAWAFVDRTNGDILKPASYAAPAKHARGNIFDDKQGMAWIGPYGPAYLR